MKVDDISEYIDINLTCSNRCYFLLFCESAYILDLLECRYHEFKFGCVIVSLHLFQNLCFSTIFYYFTRK